MCGIGAIFAYGNGASPVDLNELIVIRDRMVSRGPDGSGAWVSDDRRIALAHRRLKILDLSQAAAQPMWNGDRTLCITFNGEIYNYKALKRSLEKEGFRFSSTSDTEVLLHLYAHKGKEMMNDLRGMYAFAIWDLRRRRLLMARDPFGIKVLYYADDGQTIRLASQVRALLASPKLHVSPEPAGHVGFFLWGAIPDPFTLYREIRALPAGHTLTVEEGGCQKLHSFCSIPKILRAAEQCYEHRSLDATERHRLLNVALRDSVEHHLIGDVPIGVFLSSGVDSSTITALARESHRAVRTITVAFDEYRGTARDESPLAEMVARHYQTQHDTIIIAPSDLAADPERILDAMDQPTVGGLNTYLVGLAASRAGLKVALSGLGGDELFGGYSSFRNVPRLVAWSNRLRCLSKFGRRLRMISSSSVKRFLPPKYAGLFEYGRTYPEAYLLRRGLFMPWELPELFPADVVREAWGALNTSAELSWTCDALDASRLKVCALESCWYMRHQLLRDSDWGGMAHSLEIRTPLVDEHLLRQISPLLAHPDPPGKRDLALSPTVPLPAAVLARPKSGFYVPVRKWVKSSDPSIACEYGFRSWARKVYGHVAKPFSLLTQR